MQINYTKFHQNETEVYKLKEANTEFLSLLATLMDHVTLNQYSSSFSAIYCTKFC
jgi:hypothetical protein